MGIKLKITEAGEVEIAKHPTIFSDPPENPLYIEGGKTEETTLDFNNLSLFEQTILFNRAKASIECSREGYFEWLDQLRIIGMEDGAWHVCNPSGHSLDPLKQQAELITGRAVLVLDWGYRG